MPIGLFFLGLFPHRCPFPDLKAARNIYFILTGDHHHLCRVLTFPESPLTPSGVSTLFFETLLVFDFEDYLGRLIPFSSLVGAKQLSFLILLLLLRG